MASLAWNWLLPLAWTYGDFRVNWHLCTVVGNFSLMYVPQLICGRRLLKRSTDWFWKLDMTDMIGRVKIGEATDRSNNVRSFWSEVCRSGTDDRRPCIGWTSERPRSTRWLPWMRWPTENPRERRRCPPRTNTASTPTATWSLESPQHQLFIQKLSSLVLINTQTNETGLTPITQLFSPLHQFPLCTFRSTVTRSCTPYMGR